MPSYVEWQDSFLQHFENPKKGKDGYNVLCPAHKDQNPSLHITFKDEKALLKCYAGCPFDRILNAAGLTPYDTFYHPNGDRSATTQEPTKNPKRSFIEIDFNHPTKIYSYTDELGNELYQNCRYETDRQGRKLEKKTFRHRHKKKDEWAYSLDKIRRVPYKLPLLITEPNIIYDCEGEKDAENLIELGVTATSTIKEAYAELKTFCVGKIIIVCVDNDEPGEKKAEEKANAYWNAGASAIKLLKFPELPEKADVSDWLAEGHDIFDLQIRIQDIPLYNPLLPITVDFFHEVTPRKPLIEIDGRNALPSGNIGGLVAGIGVGKSHFLEIIISSAIMPCCEPESFLDVSLQDGERIALLDTEQTEDDCKQALERIWKRTGQRAETRTDDKREFKKLSILSLLALELAERREKLSMVLARPEFKLICLDGMLDFVGNPNDPAESAQFITWLHTMAARYDKGVFCILHGNRNDVTGKGKGWVGDLFQRKATCFLMLRKHKIDPTIRVVTTDFDNVKFRKGDDTGLNVAMQWDLDLHGFRCIPYIEETDNKKFSREAIFRKCFQDRYQLMKKELTALYMRYSGKSQPTAYKHIDAAIGYEIERVSVNGTPMYVLKNSKEW